VHRWLSSSLMVRFSLLSLVLLVLIGAGLGWVLQQQMEHAALVQQADEIAIVLDSTLSGKVQQSDLDFPAQHGEEARWRHLAGLLLRADPHLVRIKVWNRQSQVVYSNRAQEIGRSYPVDSELRKALSGRRSLDISTLGKTENALDGMRYSRLLETYTPLRADGTIVGAYEAYSDLAGVDAQMARVRTTLWGSVALGFLLLYLSLFAVVRAASRRLVYQMRAINALEIQARETAALRQVESLKDEFIGHVSHELRRPLASIKGYTEVLLTRTDDLRAEDQTEFLTIINEESGHLAGLIDDLLDVARLGSTSFSLAIEPLHLPSLIRQIVRRLESQSHLPHHRYDIAFDPAFPPIPGDAARMTQVFLNVLENAAKYSPAGTTIRVDGESHADTVSVRVTDEGPGIDRDDVVHIFDKFYRAKRSAGGAVGGTGLGLAICRDVTEAHGGTIVVDSVPGKGSTFTVALPIGSPDVNAARSA
jgi:signal transduction histidine kinase